MCPTDQQLQTYLNYKKYFLQGGTKVCVVLQLTIFSVSLIYNFKYNPYDYRRKIQFRKALKT